MRRMLGAVAIAAALLIPTSPALAEWFGIRWSVAVTPPTVVVLNDATIGRISGQVQQTTQLWSDATTVLKIEYHQVANCAQMVNGVLWVCPEDFGSPGPASYTTFWWNGKNNINIRKDEVHLNTYYTCDPNPPPGQLPCTGFFGGPNAEDPSLDGIRAYLLCHEMGAALGLAERDHVPDEAQFAGCMELYGYNPPWPSPDDIATLYRVYGGKDCSPFCPVP